MVLVYSIFPLLAYLVGSIPTGAWFARLTKNVDITEHGSGNIGATNVSRIVGFKYFFLILFLDAIKAYLFLQLVKFYSFSHGLVILCAFFLFIGNGFSLFLGGKGGKGVATALGVIVALKAVLLNCCFLVWSGVFLATRNVGLSSIVSLMSLPFFAFALAPKEYDLILLCIFICIWGLWRHESNIKALFAE